MKRTTSLRILACFLITFLLLPGALLPVAAAETETVYIEDTFEQFDITSGNVPDKYVSSDYSGSTNYAIVSDALAGKRSALINDHIDWRWWARP